MPRSHRRAENESGDARLYAPDGLPRSRTLRARLPHLSCRQFLFPYITTDDRFIGLTNWDFEQVCGLSATRPQALIERFTTSTINCSTNIKEYDSYYFLSEDMRAVFKSCRRIPSRSGWVDYLPQSATTPLAGRPRPLPQIRSYASRSDRIVFTDFEYEIAFAHGKDLG